MFGVIITLIIIVCVLLILVVLAQSSKGGGAGSMMGGSTQLIGVKRSTDLLEKLTWGFGAALLALSLISTFTLTGPDDANLEDDPNVERALSSPDVQTVPQMNAPANDGTTPPAGNQ